MTIRIKHNISLSVVFLESAVKKDFLPSVVFLESVVKKDFLPSAVRLLPAECMTITQELRKCILWYKDTFLFPLSWVPEFQILSSFTEFIFRVRLPPHYQKHTRNSLFYLANFSFLYLDPSENILPGGSFLSGQNIQILYETLKISQNKGHSG